MIKTLLLFGISFCAFSVLMGAFGAHSLKQKLSEYSMSVYEKAVLYQFFHAFAIIFIASIFYTIQPLFMEINFDLNEKKITLKVAKKRQLKSLLIQI